MGIILFLVARFLQWILTPFFFIYAIFRQPNIGKYFHDVAFGIDQLGNVMGAPMMNDLLLKKEPAKLYGNPDETISHVTAVNYFNGKLTWLGRLVAYTLDSVDKFHMKKAYENEQ